MGRGEGRASYKLHNHGARPSMMGGCYAVYMGTCVKVGLGATPAGGQWADTDSCVDNIGHDWSKGLGLDPLCSFVNL